MVSLDGSSDEDGDDYAMHQQEFEQRSRYPLHDCCEFEDADTLRVSSTNAAPLLGTRVLPASEGCQIAVFVLDGFIWV